MSTTHSSRSGLFSSDALRLLLVAASGALALGCHGGESHDGTRGLGTAHKDAGGDEDESTPESDAGSDDSGDIDPGSDAGSPDAGSPDAGDSGTGNEAGSDAGQPDAGPAPDASVAATCPGLEIKMLGSSQTTITTDTHWSAARYKLAATVSIRNAQLTIDPCSVIELPSGATIDVKEAGALKAVGSAAQPITFTSGKATGAAGDWTGIQIYSGSSNESELGYAVVQYAGSENYGGIWVDGRATLSLHDSTVQDSSGVGVYAEDGARLKDFARNTLKNNQKGALRVGANGVGQLGAGTYAPNKVDGILVRQETVDHDATWLAHDAPYVAENGFSAASQNGSALIVLSAGSTLKLGPGAIIAINDNAGFELAGTQAAPVTITSSKSAGAAGDWGEIDIYHGSSDAHNKFTYAVLEYGGHNANYGMVWVEGGAGVSITHSKLQGSGGFGLFAASGATLNAFSDNSVTGCAKGPVHIGANGLGQLGTGTYSPNPAPAIQVAQEVVDHDATWLALDAPYAFPNGFYVGGSQIASAHVTVAAGTTLQLLGSVAVRDGGGLTLAGTADKHVTVTCGKSACSPGDWVEFDFYGSSVDAYNSFSYVDVAYGGGSSYGQAWIDAGATLTLDHTVFSHSGSTNACDVYVSNNTTSTLNASGSTYSLCAH